MKVTPVAAGQGAPGVDLNQGNGRTSADRIAAAKAIAAGQTPMRQGPSDTPTDPQVARMQNSMRKIKMRTQVSPDRPLEEIPTEPAGNQDPNAENPVEPVQSATPDADVEAQGSEETKPLSPQFAALAKAKRALQQERAVFDKAKADFEASRTSSSGGIDLARLKADPLSVLDEHGVLNDTFYNALTERLVNGQSNPAASEIKALRAEIAELRSGVDTKLSERDNQQVENVISEIKREASQLVSTGDEFKYTRAMRKSDEASRLIHENWKATGEVWETRHALGLIEAECKKEYDALTSALTPQQEAQAALQQQQRQPQQQQGMKTLTSRNTAQPFLSRRDRMIAAFEGRLKK